MKRNNVYQMVLVFVLLFLSNTIKAQHKSIAEEIDYYKNPTLGITAQKNSIRTAKTTGTKQSRLIAENIYLHTGSEFYRNDTIAYTYSGAHYKTNDSFWMCDNSFEIYLPSATSTKEYYSYTANTYDTKNNLLSKQEEVYDISGYLNGHYYELTYNSDNRPISFNYKIRYGSSTSPWTKNDSVSYDYDAYGNRTKLYVFSWNNTDAVWVNTWNRDYAFDSTPKHNLLEYKNLQWNSLAKTWVGTQELNSYDISGNKTYTLYKTIDTFTKTLNNASQLMYTYDPSNNLITTKVQKWIPSSASWSDSSQTTNSYDALNNVLETIFEYWDSKSLTWKNLVKVENSYAGKNLLSSYTLRLDTAAHKFDTTYRYNYTYDASNRLLSSSKTYPVSPIYVILHDRSKHLYSYDAAGNIAEIITMEPATPYAVAPPWYNTSRQTNHYNGYNQLTLQSIDSWDGTSSTWGFHAGDTINNYYYEEFSTDIPELKDAGIQMKVYPVPANDQMAIEMTLDKVQDINIALYDLKGNIWNSWQKRMVKDFKENLQTSQLPSGNYIIQVKGSLGAYSSQCITVAH